MGDKAMSKKEVLKIAEDKDVKFIRLWFADITGQMKGFTITREELEDALSLDEAVRTSQSFRDYGEIRAELIREGRL